MSDEKHAHVDDLTRERIEDLRSENNELKQRIGDLIDAIYEHREKVSVGYGIGSYKTAHAANMELWKAIGRK